MKPSNLSLNRLFLLVTTMLFSPAVAAAQEAQPTTPPATTQEEVGDSFVDEDGAIVVLGRNIPQPMRETSEVVTILSAEDLARTGDDNAAVALTRLTGLSIVSGRFVYVRGLGDRYSSALLNGSPLPSPEPLRRQVPLDLFPSNILDGATVQKTFSPGYPGEFGGGIIDLRTVRLPNESFLTVKLGVGGNSETWQQSGLTYFGEESDWSGVGDSIRDMPLTLSNALRRNVRLQPGAFTDAELEAIGESFTNSPLTVLQRDDLPADFEAEVTAGARFDLRGLDVGLVAVGGYDSSNRTRIAERVSIINGAEGRDRDSFTTQWDIVANLFTSASVGWGQNEITLTGLIVRSTSKFAQITEGCSAALDPACVRLERTESGAWYERQLNSVQLSGSHRFGDLDLSWRGAVANSERDAPYERSITYEFDGTAASPIYRFGGNNQTRFSYLDDEVTSFGADASYTFRFGQRTAVLSGGFAHSETDRRSEFYSFGFQAPFGVNDPNVLIQRPDFLFSPDNIDPNRFVLFESAQLDTNYVGTLEVDAAYVSADIEVNPLIRIAVGGRYEDATQTVDTFTRFDPGVAAPTSIEESYFLPAATLTWNFAEDMQLRLGYSQTIARPQFRELSFTPFLDPDTDREYQGNPYLTDTEFQNYDARVEYYLTQRSFLTGGVFYKTIERPIEEVIIVGGNGVDTVTRFLNAPEADLYGAEIEYRTYFDMPWEIPFLRTPEWFFAANYTYTFSEVNNQGRVVNISADPTGINQNPPFSGNPPTVPASQFIDSGSQLQGTPEHIANLQFGFETEHSQLTLLLGYVSERIAQRGLSGLATVFEEPGVNLDVVYRRNFTIGESDFTLGFSARNLLNTPYEEYQESPGVGRTPFNEYDRGTSVSLSLTARY